MMNLQFKNAEFDYEPYPICYIPNFIEPSLYQELSDSYPSLELFNSEIFKGKKLTLSELVNKKEYYEFLDKNPRWKEFFEMVKRKEFIEDVMKFLDEKNIDLRMKKFRYTADVKKKQSRIVSLYSKQPTLRTRFEFSALPANGGQVVPHTDVAAKMVTLVISFMKPDEWQAEWGGGTEVVLPKKREFIYNYSNKEMPFEDMEIIKTFPFEPNQCVLFIKTYDSWHSVHPIKGPNSAWRKTVTLNIERLST